MPGPQGRRLIAPPVEAAGLLPERFRILRQLGRGGMGVVYSAYDKEKQREVAVKFLTESTRESGARRFRRERDDLARLSHPNVVEFYEAGSHEGNEFLVVELVDGGDLQRYLNVHRPGLRAILEIFVQLAVGLTYLHSVGLVHRDFKPENVLMTREGVAKITDFGVARAVDQERSQLTTASTILGTTNYLAPEQIRSSRAVGPAADMYAFGCSLFQAVTGRPLFEGVQEFELLERHLEDTPPSASSLRPDLPDALDFLIAQLVEKAPEGRPEAQQVVVRLGNILAALPADLPGPAPAEEPAVEAASQDEGSPRPAASGLAPMPPDPFQIVPPPPPPRRPSATSARPSAGRRRSRVRAEWLWIGAFAVFALLVVFALAHFRKEAVVTAVETPRSAPPPALESQPYREMTGTLVVQFAPVDATVSVDGVQVPPQHPPGRVQVSFLQPGIHQLEVSHRGCAPYTEVVRILADRTHESSTVLKRNRDLRSERRPRVFRKPTVGVPPQWAPPPPRRAPDEF